MPDDDKKDPPKEDATRASLVTASQSDDPEKAARAKRALASYDSDESDDSDKKDEKPSSADDKEEPKSAAAVAQLAARVQALSADLAARDARDAAAEASAFYAGCSHLDGELVATLKALPLAHAKAIVAKLPKAPSAAAVLAAVPGFVPGDGQGEGSAMRSAPEEQARINAAFGETSATLAKAEFNGATNIQTFGRVTVAPKGK